MRSLRARQLTQQDFHDFDHLVAMDNGHLQAMRSLAPDGTHHKISLFLDTLPSHKGQDTPDPYYGSQQDFEHVFDLVNHGCAALLEQLNR